jgi:hypothetical protein
MEATSSTGQYVPLPNMPALSDWSDEDKAFAARERFRSRVRLRGLRGCFFHDDGEKPIKNEDYEALKYADVAVCPWCGMFATKDDACNFVECGVTNDMTSTATSTGPILTGTNIMTSSYAPEVEIKHTWTLPADVGCKGPFCFHCCKRLCRENAGGMHGDCCRNAFLNPDAPWSGHWHPYTFEDIFCACGKNPHCGNLSAWATDHVAKFGSGLQ